MDDEEQRLWREANRAMTKDTRARIPCEDCQIDFAVGMAMRGKCKVFKGWQQPLNGQEEA